jgi:hypothetical protein
VWVVGILLALLPQRLSAQLVLQEIHADPPNPTERLEFVELVNTNSQPVNLLGWRIEGGIRFTFPSVTVPAGER